MESKLLISKSIAKDDFERFIGSKQFGYLVCRNANTNEPFGTFK